MPQVGQFAGNQRLAKYQDHEITLVSRGVHLFSDLQDRAAWVVHMPAYDSFGLDLKPADSVVGAVTVLLQNTALSELSWLGGWRLDFGGKKNQKWN